MNFNRLTSTVPLATDSEGVVRIGSTRVSLDSVIGAFRNGATSEEIVLQYPVLDLSDVYAVIGFYLKNKGEVEQYLEQQQAETDVLRQKIETRFQAAEMRQRLLKRRPASKSVAS